MVAGGSGGRSRGEGGERETRKRAREEDDQEVDVKRDCCGCVVKCKNKRCQCEMTKRATMRAEEKRYGTKRSGKQPGLEGPWEGRGESEGVKLVQWEELTKTQRKNRSRRVKRDDNRKVRSHA